MVMLAATFRWPALYFGVYLGYGNYKVRGHYEFAANGSSQIKPAKEMATLFARCRHFISYGPNEVPLFNSVASFGNRYVLTMQVEVEIQSRSSGTMVGRPRFQLLEVDDVTLLPSGQVQASFSRDLNFGDTEWQQVYASGGDLTTIGFDVDTTAVANIRQLVDTHRPSN